MYLCSLSFYYKNELFYKNCHNFCLFFVDKNTLWKKTFAIHVQATVINEYASIEIYICVINVWVQWCCHRKMPTRLRTHTPEYGEAMSLTRNKRKNNYWTFVPILRTAACETLRCRSFHICSTSAILIEHHTLFRSSTTTVISKRVLILLFNFSFIF